MTPELIRTLETVSRVMAAAEGEWWIIGSAAMAVAGMDMDPVDVDIFAASAALAPVLYALGIEALPPQGSDLFRSFPFAWLKIPGALTIEFMGSLEICREGRWRPLSIATRQPVAIGNAELFIPRLREQAEILRLFGRDKDLNRAAQIDAFLAKGGPI